MLTPLFQANVEQSYYPRAFKVAYPIVLKKSLGNMDLGMDRGKKGPAPFL